MYSNDLTQIRTGLVNYLGACLQASPFEGKAAAHDVVAILTEESLKLSQQEKDAPFDLYILKPLLRGSSHILRQRTAELSKLPKTQEVSDKMLEYANAVDTLEKLLKSIN